MSDNVLQLIPIDPEYVPEADAQAQAFDVLRHVVPQADEITMYATDEVEFINAGGNLERVVCPSCGKELEMEWWVQVVNDAYEQTHFRDLMVTMLCCRSLRSLNDLWYDWPVGFARFRLAARNPGTDISDDVLHSLESLIGCTLRKVWAHY